jgi:hypothetical protein
VITFSLRWFFSRSKPINKVDDPRAIYAVSNELVRLMIKPKIGGATTTPKKVTKSPPPVALETSSAATWRVISAR